MQVNILSALDFIFKGAPAAQWMIDKSTKVPERIWSHQLNIKEKKVLKRLKEYWSLELDEMYHYQEADHDEDLLPDEIIKRFPDILIS